VERDQPRVAAPPAPVRAVRDEGRLLNELVGIVAFAAAVFLFLSLFAYDRGGESAAFAGRVGEGLANASLQALGLATYLWPLYLAAIAVMLFRQAPDELSFARLAGACVSTLSLAMLLATVAPAGPVTAAGGWIGGFAAAVMRQAFGTLGTALVALVVLLVSFVFVTRVSLVGLWAFAAGGTRRLADGLRVLRVRRPAAPAPHGGPANVRKEPDPVAPAPIIVLADETERHVPERRKRSASRAVQEELPFDREGPYQLPPLEFLDVPQRGAIRIDEDALRRSSQILETKLGDFGIQGRVVEVRPGPVITTFDIEPAPGVKVSRVVNLADDLAMALRVPGVRILAPVPGKAVVGIEVANPRRDDVRLRELLESEPFQRSTSDLTLALGKDTAGAPVTGDLARMPHLLIAGATGSGKSVAINAMIMSILYKAQPRDVRFVMIDLKMLELSIYEDIPHLLVPVVTDPKRAVVVLKNIVEQMDERYRLMKRFAVRGVDAYNRLVDGEAGDRESGVIELTELVDEGPDGGGPSGPATTGRLPKIVVIIDELADLMMTMQRHVEEPITRLAQKARAAGIHLILATQRPSVDVITGLIKANFPARCSFQTTSRVDSRTILDQIGAERLLGGGDMLYMPPGSAKLQRLHGPLVTETEIRKVVNLIKRQGAPEYAFELLESPDKDEDAEVEDELDDELYDQAVQLVTETRQASISWVQRRLRVGYNRAARMIERMEREGVVSSSEGGRPREVLAQRIERE